MIFSNGDRIVFAGDSVTDMGSANPVGEGLFENVGRSYVRVIENMLVAWYPEMNFRITNSGISGNTSRDLMERFDRDVVNLNPDWVSICIGINDVWRQFDSPALLHTHVSPEDYRANLRAMIEQTLPKVKEIILMTPYYMEPNKTDALRKRMDEYGTIMKEVAGEFELSCVDLQAAFDDYLQYRHSSYIMWDRIHPGWVGSLIIARELLKLVGFDRPIV